jgi:hypothetical protein
MENTEKSAAPTPTGGGGAKEKLEKQARQLAYDVRYKVRGALKAQSGGKSDPATVKKAYMSQLGKSPANPAVKTRAKQMLVGEDYINLNKAVADSVASAMFKVFVEHHEKDADGNVIPHEEINEDETKEKTYKVRVTDKESGNSYVRNATRAKIAELRNNPNISSVEMTEYGEVTKSEKYKGSKTASVKSGKGVDYDGDGKVESGSKEHAGVVHNAIQKKKGGKQDGKDTRKENYTWKEAFSGLIEKKSEEEDKKITGKGVNNAKLIKVFPDEVKEGYGNPKKKPPLLNKKVKEDAEYGYDKEGNSLNPEDIKKKNEKDPNGKAKKEEDEDPRSIPTKMNLVRNKLRAMGLKMSQELEGEQLDELNKRERVEAGQGKRAAKKGDWSKQKAKTGRRNINRFETKPVEREDGSLNKGKQSYKKVKVLNPKSGYSKKTDATKGKVTSRKLSQTGTDSKPDYGPQKPHWAGNVHSDRAQQQRRSEHKAKRGVKTKGTVASDIKKSMKETFDTSVQSALDSLNTYYTKNEKLHGSLIHNEDAALDFVKKKIEREHGKGAYVSKDNPRKPQSADDKAKVRAHQAKVDAENAAARAKDPSQGRYPKG